MANKGIPFERQICKALSVWWVGDLQGALHIVADPKYKYDGEADDDLFWRTSQSGGRATTRSRKGKQGARGHCGDVSATDKEGAPLVELITFELKRGYPHSHIDLLLDQPPRLKPPVFQTWIDQAEAARLRAKTLYWTIIHRRDRRLACVYYPYLLHCRFIKLGCFEDEVRHYGILFDNPADKYGGVVGLTLDTFLSMVDPGDIRVIHRRLT